jgi:hypothetical protein
VWFGSTSRLEGKARVFPFLFGQAWEGRKQGGRWEREVFTSSLYRKTHAVVDGTSYGWRDSSVWLVRFEDL